MLFKCSECALLPLLFLFLLLSFLFVIPAGNLLPSLLGPRQTLRARNHFCPHFLRHANKNGRKQIPSGNDKQERQKQRNRLYPSSCTATPSTSASAETANP